MTIFSVAALIIVAFKQKRFTIQKKSFNRSYQRKKKSQVKNKWMDCFTTIIMVASNPDQKFEVIVVAAFSEFSTLFIWTLWTVMSSKSAVNVLFWTILMGKKIQDRKLAGDSVSSEKIYPRITIY